MTRYTSKMCVALPSKVTKEKNESLKRAYNYFIFLFPLKIDCSNKRSNTTESNSDYYPEIMINQLKKN